MDKLEFLYRHNAPCAQTQVYADFLLEAGRCMETEAPREVARIRDQWGYGEGDGQLNLYNTANGSGEGGGDGDGEWTTYGDDMGFGHSSDDSDRIDPGEGDGQDIEESHDFIDNGSGFGEGMGDRTLDEEDAIDQDPWFLSSFVTLP